MKVNNIFSSSGQHPASERVLGSESDNEVKNILIVEDDMFMAGLLERKFKQGKFKIMRASSVDQAREILSSSQVDLILLDVVLPGTDGFTFLRELKAGEKFRNIPVMITSNLGQQEEIERGISDGAADYIVKAHSAPSEIVEKVETALRGK
jgi:DNA-binding response OmpR family regulator